MAFKHWTAIEPGKSETMPPINEPVLMVRAKREFLRQWHKFLTPEHRAYTIGKHFYTHWRREMMSDFP